MEGKEEKKEVRGTPPGASGEEPLEGKVKEKPGETMEPLSDRDHTAKE